MAKLGPADGVAVDQPRLPDEGVQEGPETPLKYCFGRQGKCYKQLGRGEPEGQFDMQIERGTACWSCGVAPRLSRMLKHPRASEAEGQCDLQFAREAASWPSWGAAWRLGPVTWRQVCKKSDEAASGWP